MKYAVLCDRFGETMCGADGVLYLDGRWNRESGLQAAREYRERFRKNFPHKVDFWTHVGFTNKLQDGRLQNRVEL